MLISFRTFQHNSLSNSEFLFLVILIENKLKIEHFSICIRQYDTLLRLYLEALKEIWNWWWCLRWNTTNTNSYAYSDAARIQRRLHWPGNITCSIYCTAAVVLILVFNQIITLQITAKRSHKNSFGHASVLSWVDEYAAAHRDAQWDYFYI